MFVKVKKLKDNAIIPQYAKPGDAGLDLVATDILQSNAIQVTYGTGLAFEIPEGYVGLVFPRSSIRKYTLSLSNSVGVIDSGYRGEVQVTFNRTEVNYSNGEIYNVGDKVAQLIIMPYPLVTLVESNELSDTARGTGGFGSTGN